MFDEVEDDFSEPGGDEVGCVAEHYCAFRGGANGWVLGLLGLIRQKGFVGQPPLALYRLISIVIVVE